MPILWSRMSWGPGREEVRLGIREGPTVKPHPMEMERPVQELWGATRVGVRLPDHDVGPG